MKKVFLLVLTLFLFTSCADVFCDIVNNWDARKEAKKEAEGAGKLPYAVTSSNINMYVTSKSGWQEVYWSYPHTWAQIIDNDNVRPRFWQMEAEVTPYPSAENPLVYIVQYPEIVNDSTKVLTKWNNQVKAEMLGIREHCSTWEVIASDKRVPPVLMAGDGGFPYKRPKVMALLESYCSEMKRIQAIIDTLTLADYSARTLFWDEINTSGTMILNNRKNNIPSDYDPGYRCPSFNDYFSDASAWLPTWTTGNYVNAVSNGGGGYMKKSIGGRFYLRHNSLDETGWGTPLAKPASSVLGVSVGGYKYGDYCRTFLFFNESDFYDGSVSQEAETIVTYYCILPEASGSTYPIWCQNPEDWRK